MMPGIARAARNHSQPGAAIRGAAMAALLAAPLAALPPATALGQGIAPPAPGAPSGTPAVAPDPAADPLVQRGVPAEATAENGVVARERALAAGQRIAYERMAAATGLPRGIPDSQIDSLVQSLVIEQERVAPTRYVARITVNFSPQRVAAMGGRAQAAAPGLAAPAATPGAAAPGLTAPAGPALQAVVVVEAVARYRSFPEWVEMTRRLTGSGQVARMDILAIAPDQARLRLGLASEAPLAVQGLAQSGLLLAPAQPPARTGEGWRLDLAGRR